MSIRNYLDCPQCKRIAYYYRSIHEGNNATYYYKCSCGIEFSKEFKKVSKEEKSCIQVEKKWLFCPVCKVQHHTEILGEMQSVNIPCYKCWVAIQEEENKNKTAKAKA